MSLDLGHSGSYINSITSGRTVPSLKEFLYICEYLHITPEKFFQAEDNISPIKRKVISQIINLDDNDASLICNIIERFENN